eukprot:m.19966 g.19966  ORF g.19966 m.19966 type:complete len:718 (+) comp8103_c1_seq1:143-2296(+)
MSGIITAKFLADAPPTRVREAKFERATQTLDANPFDIGAWEFVLAEIHSGPLSLEQARQELERFLYFFPSSSKYWHVYISLEISHNNNDIVPKLFERCMSKCQHIELWKLYLSFHANLGTPPMRMAEEYRTAIEQFKPDLSVNVLCELFARFTKETLENAQALRKAYQNALDIPMHNIEKLRMDYLDFAREAFSKSVFDGILKRSSPHYQQARQAARELETVTRGLNKQRLAVPPGTSSLFDGDSARQIQIWEKYLETEKAGKPMSDETPEVTHARVVQRVLFVYKQYIACFYRHANVWYEAVSYIIQQGKIAKNEGNGELYDTCMRAANELFQSAVEACPLDYILHFSYADFLEEQNQVLKATAVYQNIIANADPQTDLSIVFIQYMRHGRRTGKTLELRKVFKQALKWLKDAKKIEQEHSGFQVLVANGLMELCLPQTSDVKTPTQICKAVLELSAKFPHISANVNFALEYINFLIGIGDATNARAEFKRFLLTVSPKDADVLYSHFIEFEAMHGDLATVLQLEQEREQHKLKLQGTSQQRLDIDTALPPTTEQLMMRYSYKGIYPCPASHISLFTSKAPAPRSDHMHGDTAASTVTAGGDAMDQGQSLYSAFPIPDVSQYSAYRPFRDTPGVTLCRPPTVAQLMKELPPPSSYKGPLVDVDMLIKELAARPIPATHETAAAIKRAKRAAEASDAEAPSGQSLFRQRQRAKKSEN